MIIRVPAEIILGPFVLHLDVLAERISRRRRMLRRLAVAVIAVQLVVLGVLVFGPRLRGVGTLIVPAIPDGAAVQIDRRAVAAGVLALPAGRHIVTAQQAGAFPVLAEVAVTRDHTTTLQLPPFRSIPIVQPVPLPHQQSAWLGAAPDAGGGWRLRADRPIENDDNRRPGWGPVPSVVPYSLHLDQNGLTWLGVLETYPIADEIVDQQGRRWWAVWEPSAPQRSATLSLATPSGTKTVSTTVELQGLWWAPGGTRLLAAAPHDAGLDLFLLDSRRPEFTTPVVTLPGGIDAVLWHPSGRAVVVVAALRRQADAQQVVQGTARTATPIADEPGLALERTAVVLRLDKAPFSSERLPAPPVRPAGLVPLAWTDEALWWVGDTGLGLALDRVSLTDRQRTRVGQLPDDIAALTVHGNSVVLIRGTTDLTVERWPNRAILFAIPGMTAHGAAGGTWQGQDVVLATDSRSLWYVHIQPEALR